MPKQHAPGFVPDRPINTIVSKNAKQASMTERLELLAKAKDLSNLHYFIDARKPEESITKVKKGRTPFVGLIMTSFRSSGIRSIRQIERIGKARWGIQRLRISKSRILESKERSSKGKVQRAIQRTGKARDTTVNGQCSIRSKRIHCISCRQKSKMLRSTTNISTTYTTINKYLFILSLWIFFNCLQFYILYDSTVYTWYLNVDIF